MKSWQYLTVRRQLLLGGNLKALGEKGWELCTLDGDYFIFKRPVEKP